MPMNVAITWKVLGSILGFLASVIGVTSYATWEVRKDYIEDLKNQVAVFNQSESWKLPDTLRKLNSVSDKLQSQLSYEERIKQLQLSLTSAELKVTKLEAEVGITTSKNKELGEKLVSLQQDLKKSVAPDIRFTLAEGQSYELARNQTVFGLSSIFSSSVRGSINDKDVSISLAGTTPISINDQTCTLRLIQSTLSQAVFSFVCPER